MKLFSSLALFLLCCSVSRAETSDMGDSGDDLLVEQGRFGFLTLDNSGATLSFNSTSLQYAVVAGIALLLTALILVPLLGYDVSTFLPARNDQGPHTYTDYNNYDYSSYSQFAKRSMEEAVPILEAIYNAYMKYK